MLYISNIVLYISNVGWSYILNIKILLLLVTSLGVVFGMLFQIGSFFRNNDSLSASFLLIGLVSFIGLISIILKRLFSELKQGISFEDERSKKLSYIQQEKHTFIPYIYGLLYLLFKNTSTKMTFYY